MLNCVQTCKIGGTRFDPPFERTARLHEALFGKILQAA
jgi:hypothetical protein